MSKTIGFLVWCPTSGFPQVTHPTFATANAEADRLRALHPAKAFFVMAPVKGKKTAEAAQAFSEGRAAAWGEALADIRIAEDKADRLGDEVRKLRGLAKFAAEARRWQSAVADVTCWFSGFDAAHAGRDSFERPWTPSLNVLRELNTALQDAEGVRDARDLHDDEIPF